MFAPHCPTCRTRVLLGPRRIVRMRADGGAAGAHDVVLRCWCGTDVAWDAAAPVATEVPVASGAVAVDPAGRPAEGGGHRTPVTAGG